MDHRARAIGEAVADFIRDPGAGDFESLLLQSFEHQYAANPPYRHLCALRGVSPDAVTTWRDVPPVPAPAFAEVALTCGEPTVVFRTSGTTRSGAPRGEHHVVDPSLYATSVLAGFRRFVVPDRERMRVLSLIPTVDEAPDSSLAYMAATLLDALGDEASGTFVTRNQALLGAFLAALEHASADGTPVLLLGTTLAFIPVLTAAGDAGVRCLLPPGSRLMDTGGMKGAGRAFDDEILLSRYTEVFGIPAAACVNEYGMTELLSQLYDDGLLRLLDAGWDRADDVATSRAVKHAPHWVRSRVVDPETLDDADEGVLIHYDLANCHSVSVVLTEDQAVRTDDAFVLCGRVPGAAARGCSIAMDEWLRS
jgi:hypothetical protein